MTDETATALAATSTPVKVPLGTGICSCCGTFVEANAKTCPTCGAEKILGSTVLQDFFIFSTACIVTVFYIPSSDNYFFCKDCMTHYFVQPTLIPTLFIYLMPWYCRVLLRKQVTWQPPKEAYLVKAICPYCDTVVEHRMTTCTGCGATRRSGINKIVGFVIYCFECLFFFPLFYLLQSISGSINDTVINTTQFFLIVYFSYIAFPLRDFLFRKKTKWFRYTPPKLL